MSQTQIAAGSALAKKVYGAALFAATQRRAALTNRLTGPASKQADAEAKLKAQTSPDMPLVRVTDLSKTNGDTVSVDLINTIGGSPIMGDRLATGKGKSMSFSSMDIKIDLVTQVIDAGGKMTNQRTVYNLRGLAMANLEGWFMRYHDQSTLVHLAGARGSQNGPDWVIPLSTDGDFAEIMINPVLAPTYNRHYVANAGSCTQGGLQLNSIATTDVFRLEHIDYLATLLDDLDYRLQPVKIPDDPAKDEEPMYVMLVTGRAWNSILTNTANAVWRTFLQNAWARASYGSKHPLFTGETGMWRNILIKKIDRAVRFNGGDTVTYGTAAGTATAATTTTTVAALDATHAVDRLMLLGAQAMAHVYGKNQGSETYAAWHEHLYNFDRNTEIAGDVMHGKSKLRFKVPDVTGVPTPTDQGVIVLDVTVPL